MSNLTPLTFDDFSLLCRLAGAGAGIWYPIRKPENRAQWSQTWEARREYHKSGWPYRSNAHTPTEAKAADASLSALVEWKLAALVRGKTRVNRVRVTSTGDWYCRRLLGLWSIDDGIEAVRHIHALAEHPDAEAGGSWQGDTAVADGRPWLNEYVLCFPDKTIRAPVAPEIEQELRKFQASMAGPLRHQWLDFNCTTEGSGYYRLTPEGLCIATGERVPRFTIDVPYLSDGDANALADIFNAAAVEIRTKLATPRDTPNQEIGRIPLGPIPTRRYMGSKSR